MNRKLTTRELFESFNKKVTLRTIQRDMLAIETAGLPLIQEKDKNGSFLWSFPRDYKKMVLPSIQQNELLAVHILKAYLKTFNGTKIEKDINSVIDKIEMIAPGDVYFNLDYNDSIIWNQDFGNFDYQRFNEILQDVIDSIINRFWCTVTYRSPNEPEKSLDIFIHRLFTYNGVIYLAVTSEKYDDYITLALHRIISLKKAANQTRKPKAFDLKRFRRNRFAVYSGEPVHIQLQIEKEVANYFTNRQWHPSQKISRNDDNSLLLEMDVPITWELLGWILSWHSFMKAISPPVLIDKLKKQLETTAKLYN